MVMVKTDVDGNALPCTYSVDGYAKQALDDLNNILLHDWDLILLYVGYEGDGKSTRAMLDALYLDHTYNLSRIVFTAKQFELAVDKASKGSVIHWDEADELSNNWASEVVTTIKRKLKRIRDRNLKILICTPTFHDLNKYFAIVRTRGLFHIYAKGVERGFFRFFGREAKKKLYIRGKKEMDLGAYKADFYGRFPKLPKDFPIDIESYKEKKRLSSLTRVEEKRPTDLRKDIYSRLREFNDKGKISLTRKEEGYIIGVCDRVLFDYAKDIREGLAEERATNELLSHFEEELKNG